MHCMVCSHAIPLHRRVTGAWFCSAAHTRIGMAAGLIERVQQNQTQSNWDHDGNPIHPMSCFFCGHSIGMARRIQGHAYCSEECYLAHHVHQKSEPNTGRRDAMVAAGVMGIAGAMLLLDRQSLPSKPGPVVPNTPRQRWLDLAAWRPETRDIGLTFKTEEGLNLWLAARDAWHAAGNAMQPLTSMLYSGITEFRAGAVELTTRGGAGMMVSATEDLSQYHFAAFRPVYSGGRVVDYSLDYGTRSGKKTLNLSSRRLRLEPAVASLPEATFRLEKKGHNLEAYLETRPGNRRWLNKWEEKSLPDGRVGLYVGEGHHYSVIAGRIQADDIVA